MRNKPASNIKSKQLSPGDSDYELEGQSPLQAALARRRKKIALDKTGFLSDDDKERLGVPDAGY